MKFEENPENPERPNLDGARHDDRKGMHHGELHARGGEMQVPEWRERSKGAGDRQVFFSSAD